MATITATKDGNWSDPTVWDSNPALPGAGDTVKPGGFTVAIDQNIAVTALDNTTSGGKFTVAGAITIAANLVGGAVPLMDTNHTTGTVAITGNVTGGSAANANTLRVMAAGAVTVTGNVTGGSNSTARGFYNNAAATLTITGNVTGATSPGGFNAAGGVVNVIGNVTASNSAHGAINNAAGTINVTGNVAAAGGSNDRGIQNNSTGVVNITGNVTGGSNDGAHGIHNLLAGVINITGNVVPGSHANANGVYNAATGTVAVSGTATGNNTATAIYNAGAGTITLGSATGGSAAAIYGAHNKATGTINVTGDVVGGTNASAYGLYNEAAGVVTVSGSAIASATTVAVYNNGAGSATIGRAVGNSFGPGSATSVSVAGVYGSNTAGAVTRIKSFAFGDYGQVPVAGAVTIYPDATLNKVTLLRSDSGMLILRTPGIVSSGEETMYDTSRPQSFLKATGSNTPADPLVVYVAIDKDSIREDTDYTEITGVASSSGANTAVAAPAVGYRIVWRKIKLVNKTANEMTVIIKYGATSKMTSFFTTKPDGEIYYCEEGKSLPEATALVLDLSAANAIGYDVEYLVEAI